MKYNCKLLIAILLQMSIRTFIFAQPEIPFFCHPTKDNLFKKDSLGWYYYANKDSSSIAFIAKKDESYKLFDKKNKMIAEGFLQGFTECGSCRKNGKCIEYYRNGKIKVSGYYHHGIPIGLWNEYYENGLLKKTYSFARISIDSCTGFCKIGLYEEYWENGKTKVSGYYQACKGMGNDTLEVTDVKGNFVELKVVQIPTPISKPFGIWIYYKENGEEEKREYFF